MTSVTAVTVISAIAARPTSRVMRWRNVIGAESEISSPDPPRPGATSQPAYVSARVDARDNVPVGPHRRRVTMRDVPGESALPVAACAAGCARAFVDSGAIGRYNGTMAIRVALADDNRVLRMCVREL